MTRARAGPSEQPRRGLPLILGLLLACGLAFPHGALAVGSTTYQVNPQHSGFLPGSTPAPPLTRRWERDLGDEVSYPVIADGRMFVSSTRRSEPSALISALDLSTGRTLWSRAAGTSLALPTYDAGRLFAVDAHGYLRALDPETGATDWIDKQSQYSYGTAPVAIDGLLYVVGGGAGEILYVYRESDGRLLSQSGYPDYTNTPTIDDQRIYAAGGCTEEEALDRATQAIAWRDFSPDDCVPSNGPPAALSGGRLYARAHAPTSPRGIVRNASDGAALSSFDADATPAFGGTTGLFLRDGTLRAQNTSTGDQLWSFDGDGKLASAPIVVGSNVYVVSSAGMLYALALDTGELEWSGDVGYPVAIPADQSSVGLGAGEGVLAVPAGGTIVAYSSGDIPSTPDPPAATGDAPGPAAPSDDAVTFQHDPAHDGYTDGDYAAGALRERWSRALGPEISYPIIADGRVFVAETDSDQRGSRLWAFDLADGHALWSKGLPLDDDDPLLEFHRFVGLAYGGGRLFLAATTGGVRAYDPASGAELWSATALRGVKSAPTVAGDTLYVEGEPGEVSALATADGSVRWQTRIDNEDFSSPTVAGGRVFTASECGGPEALDAATGAPAWSRFETCEGGSGFDTSVHGERLYGDGLVFDAGNGTLKDLDGTAGDTLTGPPAFDGQYVVYADYSGLVAEDVRTNRILWTLRKDGEWFVDPIIVGQRVVAGTRDGQLYTVDLATGRQEWTGKVGDGLLTRDSCCSLQSGLAAAEGTIVVPAQGRLVALDGNATGPVTRIADRPGFTSDRNPDFNFSAAGASGYECRIDDGAYEPCDSPLTTPALDDGEHRIVVRATSAAGPGPETTRWVTVDTLAPDTTITSGPPPRDRNSSSGPQFSFGSSEGGEVLSRFECSLDGAAFFSCQPPAGFPLFDGLADGPHTLRVRAIDRAGNVDPTPDAWSWTIDSDSPTLTVTGGPPAASMQTSATFHVSLDEPGTTHCTLERGSAQVFDGACPGPDVDFSGLIDDNYDLTVTGLDVAGNSSNTVERTWRVDTSPPTITVSAPVGTVSQTTATIRFVADEAVTNDECKLDEGDFAPCSDPVTYTNLAGGEHTFTVRLTDGAGNPAQSQVASWIVDDVGPTVTITREPSNPAYAADASFAYTASEPGSSFECKLDAGTWSDCPATGEGYTSLADGTHDFYVRATDGAGNLGSSTSYGWLVLGQAPQTTITSHPRAVTNATTAAFALASSIAPPGFECSLDGQPFSVCTATQSYAGMHQGSHHFEARATGSMGTDQTPASFDWVVDLTAPQTSIVEGPATTVDTGSAHLTFVASEPSGFSCRLDHSAWSACSSPVDLRGLAPGRHLFEASATDRAGNADLTPAARSWTVGANVQPPSIDRPAVRAAIDLALRSALHRLRTTGLRGLARARHLRVSFRIPASGRLVLRLELVRRKPHSLGDTKLTTTDGLSAVATIRLGSTIRARLRRSHALELRLAADFRTASGERFVLSRGGRVSPR